MSRLLAITGGASGIGAAIGTAARGAGWETALADRMPAEGCTALDVTDATAVADWIEGISGLQGLVCSAGISAATPILDTPPDLFRRILDVNVTGSFLAAQAAARAMVGGGKGGAIWPAAGLVDTEIRFSNRIGGFHAATSVQPRVQV